MQFGSLALFSITHGSFSVLHDLPAGITATTPLSYLTEAMVIHGQLFCLLST
jgi:hypothetical protein